MIFLYRRSVLRMHMIFAVTMVTMSEEAIIVRKAHRFISER